MTVDQIRYFLEIAQCGNLTEASVNLHLTQPTLSRQLTNMERELNMQLLEVYRHKNTGYVPCFFTDFDFSKLAEINERPEQGGKDWFGVEWQFVPEALAPMVTSADGRRSLRSRIWTAATGRHWRRRISGTGRIKFPT